MKADFADCLDCRCLSARRYAQRLTRLFDESLRAHDLTVNQFSLLAALVLADAMPVAALADRLGIDRTTMTRNLDLCVARGLVTVEPGADRRVRLARLTEAGRLRAADALPAWRSAQATAGSKPD